MSGDGEDVEGPVGVLPSVSQTDHGDDSKTCGGCGVGMFPVGGGTRISALTPHTVLHSETAGKHHGTGGMPPHL